MLCRHQSEEPPSPCSRTSGVPLPARVSENVNGGRSTRRVSDTAALPPDASLFDHQTAILHHFDARLGQSLRRLIIPDAELEPDALRLRGENVVDVRRNVTRTPEDVDRIARLILSAAVPARAVAVTKKPTGRVAATTGVPVDAELAADERDAGGLPGINGVTPNLTVADIAVLKVNGNVVTIAPDLERHA